MISIVVLISMAVFGTAYIFYGRFLKRQINPDDGIETPAHKMNDGVDYVPAKASLLLGQHFSAIAAAGPIVGPILAAIWFGWLPAILWIIFGAIFIGGVHDYLTLIASVRHKAESIGEIVRRYMPGSTRIFFMLFVWLALLYVITAFTDITSQTFKVVAQDTAFGPAVAASSIIYLVLAVVMGILLYRFKLKLWLMTLVFLPLVLLAVWVGPRLPENVLNFFAQFSAKQWSVFLLVYCFIASIIPMWLLLQPRGYLGGWLLYLTIFIGLVGALLGGFKISYPAVNTSGLRSLANGQLLFPFLFITIACGACSGFHALVSSGTTSKQLYKESDALPIGYGALLLEGLVGSFAVGSAGVSTLVLAAVRRVAAAQILASVVLLGLLALPMLANPVITWVTPAHRRLAIDCTSYSSALVVTAYAAEMDFYRGPGMYEWSVAGDYAFSMPRPLTASLLYLGTGLLLVAVFRPLRPRLMRR